MAKDNGGIITPDAAANYPVPTESGMDWKSTPMNNDVTGFFSGAHETMSTRQYVDPLLTGFAFVKWMKIPTWVKDKFPGFMQLTEKNLRNFDLPGDYELQTGTVQGGFSTEEVAYINGITKAQGFTMTHKEWSGSPMRHMYTYWVTGIRDPRTGVATYPLLGTTGAKEYCAANHTGELLYVVTRPDASNKTNKKIIEFAAFFTNVMPLKAPLAHFNYSAGTQDNPELQINFTGNMHIGDTVNEFAASQLESVIYYPFEYENILDMSQVGQ